MAIPTFIIDSIPFAMPGQRWGDLSELVVNPQTWDFIPYAMPGQRWGDLSELVVVPTVIDALPYAMPGQRWGDLVETLIQDMEDYYDPSSVPFVIMAGLVPAAGSFDISVGSSLTIPCGDRIAVDEDETIRVVDAFLSESQPVEPKGLHPLRTTVSIRVGSGGVPVVIFQNGSPQLGWSAAVTLTNQAGPNRGIENIGRTYVLSSPSGLPPGSEIYVTVYLEDYGRHYSITEYSFITEAPCDVTISGVYAVAKNVIMIQFTGKLSVNSDLATVSNYVFTNLSGGPTAIVQELLPVYGVAVDVIFLRVDQLRNGDIYRFELVHRSIQATSGAPLDGVVINSWPMHVTKVDSTLNSISRLYNKDLGGIIRGLVEAIMISDEKIGGDF